MYVVEIHIDSLNVHAEVQKPFTEFEAFYEAVSIILMLLFLMLIVKIKVQEFEVY